MSIHDKALDGSLKLADIETYIKGNAALINQVGGNKGLTLLCAACLGGHLDVVKDLLSCGADPNTPSTYDRTPLFFATSPQSTAPAKTRCAIIRELVSGKQALKANVNGPCDDDQNTALMFVILELKDKEVVQQLVDLGADPELKAPGQKSAKELAEELGMSDLLLTRTQRNTLWGRLIDTVVSYVMLVVAYVNKTTGGKAVGDVAKKYGLTIKDEDLPKDVLKDVEPKSVKDFQHFLNATVDDGKFGKFFSKNDPFLANLAEKASRLRDDPTTDLGKPENIKRLTHLSLYHPVIYCDDSGSMGWENRAQYQIELVERIARIATKIVPDELAGVDLRFINNSSTDRLTSDQVLPAIKAVPPNGGTNIGTNLKSKILQPLVYDVISQPSTPANPIPLRRPILVCIITDGTPEPEPPQTLKDEVVACKRALEQKGYDPTSVMFCVNQIGTDSRAEAFINGLRGDKEIKDVLYCTVGQMDTQFKDLKDNERAMEVWLLNLLTKPIMERHEE